MIQDLSWPHLLLGDSILGQAPTGSGKTLSYILPFAENKQ